MKPTFRQCCVNVTRNCNMRCKWCYLNKEELNQDLVHSISDSIYNHLVELISPLNMDVFHIIGGEPTVLPDLSNFIKIAKNKGLKHVSITTNGLKLQDEDYVKNLKESNLDSIHFSLKAWDETSMKRITDYGSFDYVEKTLQNLRKYDFNFSVFIVLSKGDIDDIVRITKIATSYGANYISFITYDEYNSSLKKDKDFFEKNDPNYIVKKFSENYDEINRITNGQFTLYMSYPLCILEPEILDKLIKNKQTASICPILKRYTITVDCDGSVFPCNVICDKNILKKNIKDFKIPEDLIDWWNSKDNLNIYNKLRRFPSEKCLTCKYKEYCGGGGVCQRSNYSYDELINGKIMDNTKNDIFLNNINHEDIVYKNVCKYN